MSQEGSKSLQQVILTDESLTKNNSHWKNGSRNGYKNLFFGILWAYILIKFFFVDIDIALAKSVGLNNISAYLTFRFIIVSVILLVIWKIIGNKRFFKNLGKFIIFPNYPGAWLLIKFFFWTIPNLLINKKLHFFLYSYIESIITFIAEFKTITLKIFAFVASFIFVFYFTSYCMIIPISLLLTLQILHIYKRYKQVFGPIKILGLDFNSDLESKNPFSRYLSRWNTFSCFPSSVKY